MPGMQSLSQTHPVAYMHSFCPVGDTVGTLKVEGINEIGVADEGRAEYDTREGELESFNKLGDAVVGAGVGAGVKVNGMVVGTLEVYIHGFNDGINEGVQLKTVGIFDGGVEYDGTIVGNLLGSNEGINEGIKLITVGFGDGEIEVGTAVGTLSLVEQLC